ncbi:LysR family transcriptional regulator [Ruminococcus sp. OA3]|uniref:LysR family transcriptional regulator n=1 Tax=Ruminococcus sp. OA3 TaxID=2914164 RepID=UPI001F05B3BD|nr:LysR family transcriptional regulator [Ruminococcus sp. OA3]MCH1981066.1 LysR family transcriptional regulator [Ruminococcus sp. OA3]
MDIKDLQYFHVVYEERSINRAAGKLFISSQGLSKIILKLEEELKTTLFERSKKGVRPTESAVFLYEKAEEIIRQYEEIRHGIYQLRVKDNTLRLACARGVLNALSFELVTDFIQGHPDIEVEWMEESNQEVKEKIASMQAEVGIVVGHTRFAEVQEMKLASRAVRLIVYQGHSLYEHREISIDELRTERILILNEQFEIFHTFCDICRAKGFEPDIAAKTVDSSFLYQLCKGHAGIGVVIDFSTVNFRMDGVRVIPLREQITWDIYQIWNKKSSLYPNVRGFQQYLTDRCKVAKDY